MTKTLLTHNAPRTLLSCTLWVVVFLFARTASAQHFNPAPERAVLDSRTTAQESLGRATHYDQLISDRASDLSWRLARESTSGRRGALIGALIASPIAFYVGTRVYREHFVDGCIGCGYQGILAGAGIIAAGAVIGYVTERALTADGEG